MQWKVITGEWILILVDLHIERIIRIGVAIQKERDVIVIDLDIKFNLATFQGSNAVLQGRHIG